MHHFDESTDRITDDCICAGCSAKDGELHHWPCDNEECPFCGGQAIYCDCINDMMDLILGRADVDTVNRFTPAEKQRWLDLIGNLRFKWQEVLDSPYETQDMYFDSPPEWCNTYEQFEEFKAITETFLETDQALDYKWEEFCTEKGRIPYLGRSDELQKYD